MKNVTSNDAAFVKKTIADAMAIYKGSSDVSKTIDTLTKLKGIGPATASLLLAVHDPDNVIFFADEAFYWLCGDGKIVPIKYNPKEYKQLYSEAKKLASRLNVAAVEVEKVAFVLMRYKGEDGKDMDKDSSSSSSSSKASGGVPTASSKRQEGTAPKATLSGGTAAAAAAAPKAAAAVSVPKRVEKRKEPVGGGDGGGGGHKDARRQDDDGWNQAVRRSKRVR